MRLFRDLLLFFVVLTALLSVWVWTQRRLPVKRQRMPLWWRHWLIGPQDRLWDSTMYGGFPMSVRISRVAGICAPLLIVACVGWWCEEHNVGRTLAILACCTVYLATVLMVAGGLTFSERGNQRLWKAQRR